MKIVTRYILREIALYFSACLVIFTGVLITVRLLQFTDLIVNKGVEPGQIALVFLAIIPTFLEIAVPMSALLGVMLAFARLSGDSEIVVLRASGISLYQLIPAVAFFGLVTFAAGLYVSLELRPWGSRELSDTLFQIARNKSTSGLDAGVFNKLGDLTLYSEEIDHSSERLRHVIVDDKRSPNMHQVIFAKDGRIISDPLQHTITFELKNGTSHQNSTGQYSLTQFSSNSIVLRPEEIYNPDAGEKEQRESQLTLVELQADIAAEQAALAEAQAAAAAPSGTPAPAATPAQPEGTKPPEIIQQIRKKITDLEIEQDRRFSMPLAAFLLALVAFPLGVQSPRAHKSWGASLSIALGLLIFIIYYSIISIGMAVVQESTIPVWLALWLPNLTIALIAVYALRRICSERWQTVAGAFEIVLNSWTRKKQN